MALRTFRALLAASTLAATTLLGGCADEQETLVVLNAVAWQGAGECSIGSSGTSQILNNGVLDTSFGTGFVAPLLVANQANRSGGVSGSNQGTDTTEVQLSDVDVTVSIPQAPEIQDALDGQNSAYLDFNAPLQSVSLSSSSTRGIIVEVLTPPAVQALNAELTSRFDPGTSVTLVADIVINAKRSGNTSGKIGVISARTFSYPITACSGCLIDCSGCPMGQCPASTPDMPITYSGGVCNNAQDFPMVPTGCGN
jgi:hypothetical protein